MTSSPQSPESVNHMTLNLDEAQEWLEILHGDSAGIINICSTVDWRGRFFYAKTETDIALEYIEKLDGQQVEGIYLRATTLKERPESGRGGDELSLILPGLWADIDIAGPGHKTTQTLPPTTEQAMRIVAESGLPEPSHWIHSGGGLYPWWLLRNPVEIDDLETFRALSAGWQKILETAAKRLGYHYGSGVGDLSRVLRIPGTVNRKAGLERPCTGLEGHAWSGPTYELDDLLEALADATPEPPQPSRIQVKQSTVDGLRPGDNYSSQVSWQEILLPLGWQWVYKRGDKWHLRRPGKDRGTSATLSDRTGNLYVFSESCQPLQSFTWYSKFAFYTFMEHGGNFKASARELARQGYGSKSSDSIDYSSVVLASIPTTGEVVKTEVKTVALNEEGFPAYDSSVMKSRNWTQQGLGDMWSGIHDGHFSYDHALKWKSWNQVKWESDKKGSSGRSADLLVRNLLAEAMKTEEENPEAGKRLVSAATKLNTSATIKAILDIASRDPRIAREHSEFDAMSHLMTVKNGTLNLETGELEPHNPKNMLTRLVNANFDPDKKEGRWTEFMEQVLPNQQVREYLQRACGYMLTGSMSERAIFLIHGESGTGKTQFLEAIRTVLGDFAGVAPASSFQPRTAGYKGPSEDLHSLMGKRFIIQSEMDAGSRLNESLVKSITGGDTQKTRTLYGELVEWEPEYTVFLATNYLPRISSSDNAIWNRVKPVKFEQVFVNGNGEALDPKSRNLGRQMAQAEPEVILNWLLEGLKMYRERGLDDPAQVREWLIGYRDDVDTVRQFLTEAPEEGRIVIEENKQVSVRDLYRSFVAHCADNAKVSLGLKAFTERMLSGGWKKVRREKGVMWQGIGIGGFVGEAQTPVRKGFGYPQQNQ